MDITMKTAEAIKLVKEHQKQHLDEYGDQIAGWQRAMEQYGRDLHAWSQGAAHLKDRPNEPVKPGQYAEDYVKLVIVLQYHTGAFIELDETAQETIIHDSFHWKKHFNVMNSTYGSGHVA